MAAIKRSLNVAVVGMGNMGVPIVRNIAFKSHSAVYLQVHSRSLQQATKVCDNLERDGAQCAMRMHNKYSTVTKWSDVIITVLRDAEAAKFALLDAPDALVTNARQGQIIVDHTTVDIDLSRACCEKARARGAGFLDAPLSGNPQSAYNGQLTIMAGGEEEVFQKMTPLLRLYGETVSLMGGAGAGSAAKGICQMLVAIHTVAAAEALHLAHRMGVEDTKRLVAALDTSWGSSTMLRRNAPLMQTLLRNPDKLPTESPTSVDSLLKELECLGRSTGGSDADPSVLCSPAYPLFRKATEVLSKASLAGVGDRDVCGVVQFLEATGDDRPLPVVSSPPEEVPKAQPETKKAVSQNPAEMEFY